MAKDKVEPKEIELSEKQQYIQLQLTDLANKEKKSYVSIRSNKSISTSF